MKKRTKKSFKKITKKDLKKIKGGLRVTLLSDENDSSMKSKRGGKPLVGTNTVTKNGEECD